MKVSRTLADIPDVIRSRKPKIASTTSNSIKVNAETRLGNERGMVYRIILYQEPPPPPPLPPPLKPPPPPKEELPEFGGVERFVMLAAMDDDIAA